MDYINKGEVRDLLNIVYGDIVLGVHGRDFHYLFSYVRGGFESLVIDGKEWLYRTPVPTFWRATTDNDRGNKFPLHSGMWAAADMFIACTDIEVMVDGEKASTLTAPENNRFTGKETADKVKVKFTYSTIASSAVQVEVTYEIAACGTINVHVHYNGNKELPQLPVFGMRFIMPTRAAGYKYEGLSGETYPDRMAGGVPGVYEITGIPVTKYLIPQDCNVHMETKWLEVYRNTTLNNADNENLTFGLRFTGNDKPFAFSCIPYTAMELENATHHEDLPPARRTVLSILGAVRGVGGIDSWGAEVESSYCIDAGEDICYSFQIKKA